MKLWNVERGEVRLSLRGHDGSVHAVAFSSDGELLVTGGNDNTVKLWNVESGKTLYTFRGHNGPVKAVEFSPDGHRIASGSTDQRVKLWAVNERQLLDTFASHSGGIRSVAFSPDGRSLASGGGDREIKIWHIKRRQVSHTLSGNHADQIFAVAFSPDGDTLASGSDNREVKLWQIGHGQMLLTLSGHTGPIFSVAFRSDGAKLASGSADQTIRLWDTRSGQHLKMLNGHSGHVKSVAFSPEGDLLASGSTDRTIKLWDVERGEVLQTLSGHSGSIFSVVFSPNGNWLASGNADGTIRLWKVEARKVSLLRTLSEHRNWVWSVAFSPDSLQLVSGSADRSVKLWNVRDSMAQRTFDGHTDWVYAMAFSPDGQTLISASRNLTVKQWDVRTGEALHTSGPQAMETHAVAFDSTGSTLASASDENIVTLWDTDTCGVKMNLVLLPNSEWLAYHPQKLVYNASAQGDTSTAVRFNHNLHSVYPLAYYRQELWRPNLASALLSPQPQIKPKRFQLWRDRAVQRIRFWGEGVVGYLRVWEDWGKSQWLLVGGLMSAIVLGFVIILILRRSLDPIDTAKHFFSQAGFQKIDVLSKTILGLHAQDGQRVGIAMYWQAERFMNPEDVVAIIEPYQQKLNGRTRLYLLYTGRGPSSGMLQSIRERLQCETIPLLLSILEKALAIEDCKRVLKDMEEPYLARIDPYTESKPIHDPTWFYGRDEFLDRLPAVLAQGQHVGLFGLRKVGKTSLINLLRQRFAATPTVFIDCQAFSEKAEIYFSEIVSQLHVELRTHGLKRLPRFPSPLDRDTFRQHVINLVERWKQAGRRERFLIILDEIDKFFPRRRALSKEVIWKEYVNLFKVLRGLAQHQQCLVTLVVAYRPDVNRYNIFMPTLEENPMFQSFQEEYLGFLSADDSDKMISEIGLSKEIIWEPEAVRRVFEYCGGHPLVTRFFASYACDEGMLKHIDTARVEATAKDIQMTLRRNEIGNYYAQGVWDLLYEDEQQVLQLICKQGKEGIAESSIPDQLNEALTNMSHFGLITMCDGKFFLSAQLMQTWLQRRIAL